MSISEERSGKMAIRVLFMGRKPVAAKCLAYLLGLQNVEVVGVLTDSHLKVSPTARLAEEVGVRVLEFDTAMDELERGTLVADIGLSMLFWRKLRGPFLKRIGRGVINFHPAPLPQYKGTGGYNLAIMDECPEWAVSSHYIDEGIDTGEIIEVDRFAICPRTATAQGLEATCQERLHRQFIRVVEKSLASETRLPTTPNAGGRYVSRAEMEAMKEIRDGDDIEKKIRAFWFPPYDGAYVIIDGRRYTLVDRPLLQQLADPASSSLFTPQLER